MTNAPQIEAFTSTIHRTIKSAQVIFFGSRLIGTARPRSDVDLMVVSDDFTGVDRMARQRLAHPAITALDFNFPDIFLLSPREWNENVFLRKIVESNRDETAAWKILVERFGRQKVMASLGRQFLSSAAFHLDRVFEEISAHPPSVPIARHRWPEPIAIIARFALQGEVGVGDTMCRALPRIGERAKEQVAVDLGLTRGCQGQRDEWNIKFPY